MANHNNNTYILEQMQIQLETRGTARIAAESGMFLLFMIIIIVGNSLTLFIVLSKSRLRTVPNMFIVSLAVADLGMGVLSMPLCMTVLTVSYWPFSDAACQYEGFVAVTMAVASTITLTLTSVNRYFRVVKPNLYRKFFTLKSTIIYIVTSWFLAAFATVPYLSTGFRMVFHPGKYFCYLHIDAGWFTAFVVSVFVALPNSIIMYCYYNVFKTVRSHQKRFMNTTGSSQVSVEEIKITRTLFVVILFFMSCWTPILIIDLIDTFRGYWSLSREVYTMYSFLALVSSSTNPIIYGYMNPTFRAEYLNILRCKWFGAACGVPSTRVNVQPANAVGPVSHPSSGNPTTTTSKLI